MNIVIYIIIGLCIGLAIGHAGRRQRDKKIAELEQKNDINQNVMEAQNATIGRLRKKLKDKGNGI